ncbi:hypothetical protein AXJ14_gp036 [Geobacillus virus E3]|uniref:hypothetical protein n=1 Tax=Geobacillus virus E3 TaxID=1572712 RepID=UPI0006719845|nr:hypothetical protein AXJ14_gp036 [Geobacillus virus E3]AJA41355.1 hypothetical protein E3_036 [Geobacillus virus E3]
MAIHKREKLVVKGKDAERFVKKALENQNILNKKKEIFKEFIGSVTSRLILNQIRDERKYGVDENG